MELRILILSSSGAGDRPRDTARSIIEDSSALIRSPNLIAGAAQSGRFPIQVIVSSGCSVRKSELRDLASLQHRMESGIRDGLNASVALTKSQLLPSISSSSLRLSQCIPRSASTVCLSTHRFYQNSERCQCVYSLREGPFPEFFARCIFVPSLLTWHRVFPRNLPSSP